MGRKTNKLLYVIFGILAALFLALVPFAAARREAFLAEGDLILADFSITMGIIGAIGCLIFVGIIVLLLVRDRKIGRRQKLFLQEVEKTPLFGRWLLDEEKQLKKKLHMPRLLVGVLTVPMIGNMVLMLILILDETGGRYLFQVVTFLFCLFVVCFVWWLTDYWKQFFCPLMRSVSGQLPTPMEKEEFAGQILKDGTGTFQYEGGPRSAASTAWVTEGYSYFRQFRKCRIIRNRDIGRVVLRKDLYAMGLGAHFRVCFVMEAYINGTDQDVWRGYFHRQDEMYQALDVLKKGGIPEDTVEDRVTQNHWKQ